MRGALAAALALTLAAAACQAATTPYDRLPDDALETVDGGLLIDDWPAVADRPYAGDSQLGMPPRFSDRLIASGLLQPTSLRFAPDGRLFVLEQRGVVKVIDSLDEAQPRIVLDIRERVFNASFRGALGLGIDPVFADQPYLYLSYTHDAPIGATAPRYGFHGEDVDTCPDDTAGCVVSGRLSRFRLGADGSAGPEQVLIEDWCHDGGHSMGAIAFDDSGALLIGSGDAAEAAVAEYGQRPQPPNPCGDPPTAVGVAPVPPTAEGGALRSQDLRTMEDPVGLGGTIVRVDRASGQALPDNPLAGDADANARRVIGYGLRNPFRFDFRPGTSELWIGDVGWLAYEELNVIEDPLAGPPPNFGWPCYDGPARQPDYDQLDLDICESLYADQRDLRMPELSLLRAENRDEDCYRNGAVISALAFYDGASFPTEYAGAMFFADSSRGCTWVVRAGTDGRPDFHTVREFRAGHRPVDFQVGPDGALYYVDYTAGSVRQIQYFAGNQPPRGRLRATPNEGVAPLSVDLDASRSSDPEGEPLSFTWDTDADGAFDDGAGARLSVTLHQPGRHFVMVRVEDASGEWTVDTARVTVTP